MDRTADKGSSSAAAQTTVVDVAPTRTTEPLFDTAAVEAASAEASSSEPVSSEASGVDSVANGLQEESRDDDDDESPAAEEEPRRSAASQEAPVFLEDELPSAAMISRYFKLTAVMVGVNVVLASASVFALFRRPGEPRTIVVTAPATPVPAKPPVASDPPTGFVAPAAPAAEDPPLAEPVTKPARATPPVAPPSRMPLLGEPAGKPSILSPPAKTKRITVASERSKPVEGESEAPGVHLAERW